MIQSFEFFVIALMKNHKTVNKVIKNAIQDDNIKHMQAAVLGTIGFTEHEGKGGVSASDIAKIIYCDKALISRILNGLKEGGYICRNPEDEKLSRNYRYILTEKGRQFKDKISALMDVCSQKLTEGISDQDVEIFFRTAIKMSENMSKLSDEITKTGGKTKNAET